MSDILYDDTPGSVGRVTVLQLLERVNAIDRELHALKAVVDQALERMDQVIERLDAPYRTREKCMGLVEGVLQAVIVGLTKVGTSGNVKWFALAAVAIAILGTGVGATLSYGDWSFSTRDPPSLEESFEPFKLGDQ